MALVVVREAVIRDLIPGRPRGDEGVELRADAGLAIERPQADRDFFPSGHSAPNRLEPQIEQKAFTRPLSGLKTRISSSPASRRNPARGIRPCVPPKAPECFRHREQWQKFARRNGALT